MSQFLEGGEPFFFPGGETGCLLIHGFTGAPKEMLGLGEHLAAQGYTVLGPRLFGHSTVLKDMIRARYIDWVASTLDGYYMIRGACTKVVIMGLSLGGALALYLGSHHPVDGLVAMSTPYVTPHPLMKPLRPILPLLSLIWRFTSLDLRSAWIAWACSTFTVASPLEYMSNTGAVIRGNPRRILANRLSTSTAPLMGYPS